MFSALLTFLGGGAFRAIFGEISSYLTARQEHQHELERMRLQGELDSAQHTRNMEQLRVASDLKISEVRVQGEQRLGELEMEGWSKAVASALNTPTGIFLVDLWNGVIRPSAASIALFLWVRALNEQGWHMSPWDQELVGAILGFFFAHRFMAARGK